MTHMGKAEETKVKCEKMLVSGSGDRNNSCDMPVLSLAVLFFLLQNCTLVLSVQEVDLACRLFSRGTFLTERSVLAATRM